MAWYRTVDYLGIVSGARGLGVALLVPKVALTKIEFDTACCRAAASRQGGDALGRVCSRQQVGAVSYDLWFSVRLYMRYRQ